MIDGASLLSIEYPQFDTVSPHPSSKIRVNKEMEAQTRLRFCDGLEYLEGYRNDQVLDFFPIFVHVRGS
jgi:hypothetical protein